MARGLQKQPARRFRDQRRPYLHPETALSTAATLELRSWPGEPGTPPRTPRERAPDPATPQRWRSSHCPTEDLRTCCRRWGCSARSTSMVLTGGSSASGNSRCGTQPPTTTTPRRHSLKISISSISAARPASAAASPPESLLAIASAERAPEVPRPPLHSADRLVAGPDTPDAARRSAGHL